MEGRIDGQVRSWICSVCGRAFPSNKSLYGHLRCHSSSQRQEATRAKLGFSAVYNDGSSLTVAGAAAFPPAANLLAVLEAGGPLPALLPAEVPPIPPARRSPGAVRCRICDATFESHLSLGGHMAHHSMQEKKRRRLLEGQGSGGNVEVVPPPPPPPLVPNDDERHCEGPPAGAGSGTGRVVRDFDLNELPPPDEEI